MCTAVVRWSLAHRRRSRVYMQVAALAALFTPFVSITYQSHVHIEPRGRGICCPSLTLMLSKAPRGAQPALNTMVMHAYEVHLSSLQLYSRVFVRAPRCCVRQYGPRDGCIKRKCRDISNAERVVRTSRRVFIGEHWSRSVVPSSVEQ